ncbi:cytidine/deoxycytidylate deaminase family protein [Candidatus Uhrbacteria bacterium]|nr:cytidine/deoxycytidylate deaminase family protein [Candidatus Uhrbacteria bacterium]
MSYKDNRPSWDDYFMAIAKIVATRSTCDRLRAGAVLVKNKRIISTGYNGAPPGLPHCDGPAGHLMEDGHCIRTVHAEENCVLQAAAMGGVSTVGSTLYSTYSPCYHCFKKLAVAGIKRIVAGKIYRDPNITEACREAGIEFAIYEPDRESMGRIAEQFISPIEEKDAPEIKTQKGGDERKKR